MRSFLLCGFFLSSSILISTSNGNHNVVVINKQSADQPVDQRTPSMPATVLPLSPQQMADDAFFRIIQSEQRHLQQNKNNNNHFAIQNRQPPNAMKKTSPMKAMQDLESRLLSATMNQNNVRKVGASLPMQIQNAGHRIVSQEMRQMPMGGQYHQHQHRIRPLRPLQRKVLVQKTDTTEQHSNDKIVLPLNSKRFNDCIETLSKHFTLIPNPRLQIQQPSSLSSSSSSLQHDQEQRDTSYPPEIVPLTSSLQNGHRMVKCHRRKFITAEDKLPFILCCGSKAFNNQNAVCINDVVQLKEQLLLPADNVKAAIKTAPQPPPPQPSTTTTTTTTSSTTTTSTTTATPLPPTTTRSEEQMLDVVNVVKMASEPETLFMNDETTMNPEPIMIDDFTSDTLLLPEKPEQNSVVDNAVQAMARSRPNTGWASEQQAFQEFTSVLCDDPQGSVFCCGNYVYKKVPGQVNTSFLS